MSIPDLKAYVVTAAFDDACVLLFARHDIVARRQGAGEVADGDISAVTCRRAPWADVYIPQGVVPASACIEQGWWFECFGCDDRLDHDSIRDRGMSVADVVGNEGGAVYCCAGCRDRHKAAAAEDARIGREFAAMLRTLVTERFGAVVFTSDKYGVVSEGSVSHCEVFFEFPGMKHGPASLRYSHDHRSVRPIRPDYRCSMGDLETFEAFAAATKEKPFAGKAMEDA